jgi:sulfoxide reductase heme-binding subunit YedZ
MQSKLEVYEPTVMAGLFAWMMGHRVIARSYGEGRSIPVWAVAALSLLAALATAGGEAVYFRLGLGIDPTLILAADLSLYAGIRPAWVVLIVAAGVTAIGAWRGTARQQSRFRTARSGAYRPS